MSKYSPEMTERICNSLRNLKGRVGACKEAGIDYRTFLDWMRDPDKLQFSQSVEAAEGEMRQNVRQLLIVRIIDHSKKYWQAGAFILKNWFPEEFNKLDAADPKTKELFENFTKTIKENHKRRQKELNFSKSREISLDSELDDATKQHSGKT